MSRVQVIEQEGRPAFYVVPADIWARVREMVEDAEDVAAIHEFDRTDDGFRVPAAVINAELGGVHPIRAWREFGGLTQEALAARAGIRAPYLSQLENGRREASSRVLSTLARELGARVDVLMPTDATSR